MQPCLFNSTSINMFVWSQAFTFLFNSACALCLSGLGLDLPKAKSWKWWKLSPAVNYNQPWHESCFAHTKAFGHIPIGAEGLLLEDAALLIGYRQELLPRTEEAAVYGKIKSLQEDCKQDIDLLPGRIERWDTFIQCDWRECWSHCSNTPCIDSSHLEEYTGKVDYE